MVITKHARRYGRFRIPSHMVREYSSELLRVMGRCAIYRAEMLYASDSIEYHAACDMFLELPEGEEAPEYTWFFTSEGDFWCEELKWPIR